MCKSKTTNGVCIGASHIFPTCTGEFSSQALGLQYSMLEINSNSNGCIVLTTCTVTLFDYLPRFRQVQHIFAETSISLPRKKTLNRKGEKFVEERRRALEQYIRQIVSLCLSQHRSPLVQNPCKQTLCEALPFLRVRSITVAAICIAPML